MDAVTGRRGAPGLPPHDHVPRVVGHHLDVHPGKSGRSPRACRVIPHPAVPEPAVSSRSPRHVIPITCLTLSDWSNEGARLESHCRLYIRRLIPDS
jgi:hypothetical protein